jgi:hypothetical protein
MNGEDHMDNREVLGGDESSKPSAAFKDLAILLGVAVLVFVLSAMFDVFNKVISWVYQHDTWQLDELFTVAVYFVLAVSVYAWRRHVEVVEQLRGRKKAEAEKARLIPELERARAEVSRVRKLVPMCSECKRIRDPKGYWHPVEVYLESHLAANVGDGLCPDCARRLYGG